MSLQSIGLKHNTDKAFAHKYCDFYEKNLPDRSFKGRLLEIGVMDGGSIAMWSEYYPNAEIVGLDIIDKSHLSYPNATLLLMDATDKKELATLGKFDIIIDDGSHFTSHQQASFEQLYYSQLKKGGIYIMEDLHTSLMPTFIDSELTTLEYLDRLDLNIEHWRRDPNDNDSMTSIIRKSKK